MKRIPAILLAVFLSCSFKGENKHAEKRHEQNGNERYIPYSVVKKGDVGIGVVEDGFIVRLRKFPAEVVRDMNRSVMVRARFPGIITEVYKLPGDRVRKGEILVRIESDESLEEYEVRSPISGYVSKMHISPGEHVKKGEPLYDIVNLSSVWVRALAYPHMVKGLKKGMRAKVFAKSFEGDTLLEGVVLSVSTEADRETRLLPFLISVANDGTLRPGMFVDVILYDSVKVDMRVPKEALHIFENDTIVFVKRGNLVVPTEVSVGRMGEEYYEIVSGLKIGDTILTNNSFVIKAELEKREWEGAGHEH